MSYRKLYDWFILLVVYSAPTLALTVPHGGTGNYKLLILLGLVTGWRQIKNFNKLEIWVFASLLLLFIANLLSMVNSDELSQGLKWLGKYLYLFLGIFAYSVIKPRFDLLKSNIDYFLLINAILIGGVALFQVYYLGYDRALGNAHPILFANISVVLFGLLLGRVFYHRRSWYLYLAGLLYLIAAALSGTRGALIAIPVLLVFLFFASDAYKQKAFQIIFLILTVILILLSTIKGSPVRDRIEYTIADLQQYSQDQSRPGGLTWRFEFWRNGIILWKDKPWLGIGPGDYNAEMKALVESGRATNDSDANYRWTVHSNLVNALVTSGIIGLIAHIFSIYLIPLILIIKEKISLQNSVYFITVLLCYFIFGLSTTWVATHAAFSIFMILFVMGLAMMERSNLQQSLNQAKNL